MFLGLSKKEREKLQFELISKSMRNKITRVLRYDCISDNSLFQLIYQNKRINIACSVLGEPKYVLEPDYHGSFEPVEIAWHESKIESIMFECNTIEFIEIIADYIQNYLIDLNSVNTILKEEECIFSYKFTDEEVSIDIKEIGEIDTDVAKDTPNISALVSRLDFAYSEKDYPNVLHTSASIFETIAKDVCNNPNLENKPLGSFFAAYKKKSLIPDAMLDYILNVYNKRNTEPTAGHGATTLPTITQKEASVLKNLTKAILLIEQEVKVS